MILKSAGQRGAGRRRRSHGTDRLCLILDVHSQFFNTEYNKEFTKPWVIGDTAPRTSAMRARPRARSGPANRQRAERKAW
jgi:hypothetical protein